MEQALELASSLGMPPTIRVDSGHGLQPYWLFHQPWIFASAAEREQAQLLVNRFQEALHGNAKDRGWKLDSTQDFARVLRVPGTTNRKPECQPVPVRLLDASGPRYDRRDLAARIPPPRASSTFRLHASPDDRELALSALAALKSSRFDDYDEWLHIGMALHAVDSSASMCAEWDRASRCMLDKYEEGACAAKWQTFDQNGKITLGSLLHWAEEDGWTNPCRRRGNGQAPTADLPVPAEKVTLAVIDTLRSSPALIRALRAILEIPPCAKS
jgi:hypothetical protein